MNILFLDDNSTRQKWFKSELPSAVCVWNAADAIAKLKNLVVWDCVFLDHDLGGETYVDSIEQNTGAEVARWIAEYQPIINLVVVHSFNHNGSMEMLNILHKAKYHTSRATFGGLLFREIIQKIKGEL